MSGCRMPWRAHTSQCLDSCSHHGGCRSFSWRGFIHFLSFPAAGTKPWISLLGLVPSPLWAALWWPVRSKISSVFWRSPRFSQLGYMMLGLGTGGVAVAMFHLITHAFFKALLFLGAGSVIHGCHDQQDIRYMGGLRKWMPTTFIAYGIGMMALAGFPLVTAGFWSKDLILHAALLAWGKDPLCDGVVGRLTHGILRDPPDGTGILWSLSGDAPDQADSSGNHSPHESPASMLWPLRILAVFAIGAGFMGTPVYPWFESFLEGQALVWQPGFGPWFHLVAFAGFILSRVDGAFLRLVVLQPTGV